jgi:phage minor structural protein
VADKEESEFIVEGNSVAFQDKDGYWQLFEIKKTTDTHNSDGITREVYAEHAYYELIDSIVTDIRPANVSAAFALQRALENTRWSVGTVADLGTNSTNFYYETALSAVQKVANTWGGELRYRVIINNNQITARYVDLPARRGEITGKRFEFTKDIKEVKRDIDISNICTAAYGRGKGEEIETAEGGTAYGRRTTFADVVWSIANGDPTDKPIGQEWIGDNDALALWGRNGNHRFAIFQDDEETDPNVLLEKTWQYVQEHKTPLITYTLDVIDLERLTGYEHEAVRLGDTVSIRDFDLNLDIAARVIEISLNLLSPGDTQVVLGNFMHDITDLAIAQSLINQRVSDRSGVWDRATAFNPDGTLSTEWLEGVIDTLQTEINAGAGTVTITEDNGILITNSATNPTKALRLLGGIFAIANSKTPEGDWNWRTFGTGDGFTADEINAGRIRTSLIEIFGSTQFYWDGDNIYIINPANSNQQIRIGKYDGTNYGIAFTTNGGATWNVAIQFNGINASAITAGTLDASRVNVTNLNASNITTGTLNGININASGDLTVENDVYLHQTTDSTGDMGSLYFGIVDPSNYTPRIYGIRHIYPDSSIGYDLRIIAPDGEVHLNSANGVFIDGATPWTSYNDGAGSGLNADLLDGKHANEVGIYASGSNSNGSYVKFGDGTMICWVTMYVTDQAINQAYGSLFIGSRTWTYPSVFYGTPTVTCSQFKWGSGASWGNVANVRSTDVDLRGYDVSSRAAGTTCIISAIAVGRWK